MTLAELNGVPRPVAQVAFERCCGAARWVRAMIEARPFASVEALHEAAERAADALGRADWLEAFGHHPRIGDVEALRRKFAGTAAWAGAEQAGVAAAAEETLHALAAGNREYEDQFGYLFVVCATGKSADEMLELLRGRLGHDSDHELGVAAHEQRKITRLRLDKLLAAD